MAVSLTGWWWSLHACLCVVVLLVWCVVWELKSVLCSIRFWHNCVLCCDDVYWWNGMLWQCAGALVVGVLVCGVDTVYVFWSYWGHVFWCGLVVLKNFVVVSAGWDIRVGRRVWGALVCLVLCVLIVFCFVSSSLFFWELWDHAFAFCFCNGEFDSGSGRTLAACLTHASRTMKPSLLGGLVANGWVIREWPTFDSGISLGNWV